MHAPFAKSMWVLMLGSMSCCCIGSVSIASSSGQAASALSGRSTGPVGVLLSNLLALLDCDSSDRIAALDTETKFLLSAFNSTSKQWPDVLYNDTAPSAWLAAIHLQRCLLLATVFRCPSSTWQGNTTVTDVAHQAVAWWITADPHNTNWWWQTFGTPNLIAKYLLMMPDDGLYQAAQVILNRCTIPTVIGFTGANRVWAAQVTVMTGLLASNESIVSESFSLMHEAYAISQVQQDDGIMPDWSFHQHGPLLYMGYGYGSHLMTNALAMEIAAIGTPWVMNATAWSILASYILDGAAWAGRGSEWELSASGRHNTYYLSPNNWSVVDGHYHFFAAYVPFTMAFPTGTEPLATPLSITPVQLFPPLFSYPRGDELQAFFDRVMQKNMSLQPVGDRHFYNGDYHVHSRRDATVSVRVFSNRTLNSECINGEGLQNRDMADGVLIVYQSGNEYSNIIAAWNWSLVPGTTELQFGSKLSCAQTQQVNHTSWVGGVSDGMNGAVAFDFLRDTGVCVLTARKSYFMVDGLVIAIGTNVTTAPDCAIPVTTSIDQRALNGQVWYGESPSTSPSLLPANSTFFRLEGQPYIWHDNLTYVSFQATHQTWLLGNADQLGSWSDIAPASNATFSVPMFTVSIPHGPKTVNAGYAYAISTGAVTPGAAQQLADNITSTVLLAAASSAAHAVCWQGWSSTSVWIFQSNFWDATSVPATGNCPTVSSNTSSIVSIVATSNATTGGMTIALTASNPMVENRPLTGGWTISGSFQGPCCSPSGSGFTTFVIVFPSGISGGQSVACTCDMLP